ncbi:MAG: ABC transporter permease [Melioribacteraceae bacterium]|nr:ABC transporter permease [Melioribacteraceae bacterium]MCF8262925.1 ABC transporter permease [Melioribacteraceae bacterium]MCF8431090.1 ABC transporter permease [Melioribacteraceae bacterium]
MFKRTAAIVKKEFKQIWRDKRLLFVMFFLPAFLLGIFGYAVSFDVKNIQLAVLDNDNSHESRLFVNSLLSSDYFELVKVIENDSEVKAILDNKSAQAVMIIPVDFSRNIIGNRKDADIQYLLDGVDGNTASIIKNYLNAATNRFNNDLLEKRMLKSSAKLSQPLDLSVRFWFNPDLNSTRFLLPGLIAMILIITAVVTVSLSLVREKELGTIEQLNVSSLRTIELLIGKVIPYLLIAVINAVLVLLAGYILFDVAVMGSYVLLFLSILIFLFAGTSLGVLVSVISDSQQVAFTIATFVSLLPSLLLSGFIFPIESMPFLIQIITNITPAKFFIVVLRAIMLRGVGVFAFWDQLIYLILFGLVALLVAVKVRNIKDAKI